MKPIVTQRDEQQNQAFESRSSTRWGLVSLALAMLLSSLDASIANVALPALAEMFSASFQAVQWVVIAYLLVVTTLVVGVGRLGDLIGRRKLFLFGIAVYTVASAVCGGASSLWLLIAGRMIQGIGGAVMMALSMAIVGETVAKTRTGSVMGMLGTMSALGTTLGPSLGGILLEGVGWRAIFLLSIPLGVVTFLLAYHFLPVHRPSPRQAERTRFDIMGTLLLAVALAAYALAMTLGRGSFGPLNMILLLVAVSGIAVFVMVEARAEAPLVQLELLREPQLKTSLAMSGLVATVVTTTLVVGPFYLAYALGLDPAEIGLVLSAGPLVAAVSAGPAGYLVDRLGPQRMTLLGLAGMTTGSSMLCILPIASGVIGYVAPLVLMTGSYSVFQTANNTSVMADVHQNMRGLVSGMLNLSRNLGRITGASLMGAVFAFASKASIMTSADQEAVALGMRVTFMVATLFLFVALVLATVKRRQPPSSSVV